MKKYSVSIPFYANVIVKVEAENEVDAINEAFKHAHPSLCAMMF